MKKAAAVVAVGLPGCPAASPVPGFLAKLWALVEDPESDDVISWSQNGQNFCIWDEQRFAKELLPKYFKHNNLSSFIRQLNIYGFRKVIALENGMMTYRNSAIEFQHPFFKQGKANLLANIKRKVSAVRAEDLKVCSEDLHKVLSEVQEMREQQNNMDMKLASMKRENKALWKEVASLRQKHSQQQQLLSKILEFILSLMRGNCILGLKRKRPITDSSGASPSKYSRPYVHIPVENCDAAALPEPSSGFEDSLVIRDITDVEEEEAEEAKTDRLLALAHTTHGDRSPQLSTKEVAPFCEALEFSESGHVAQQVDQRIKSDPVGNSAVELPSVQGGVNEDPAAVIDSILSENQAVSSTDSLLDREEIQDFLNCIDASLEELQAMLNGKKFNCSSEVLKDSFSTELPVLDVNLTEIPSSVDNVADLPESISTMRMKEPEAPEKNDMQVIQYRGNPLVSLFEEPPPSKDGCAARETQDVLQDSLESRPSNPLALDPEGPQQLLSTAVQADGATTVELLDQSLLSEDMNGDDKLFPLLLFSPVANFIEEVPETETS